MIARASFAALFLAVVTPAFADAQLHCFSMAEMGNWRSSPDSKAIYFRANVNRYYKLELARECSTLKSINPHLVLTNRTGGMICSALDLDVKVSQSPGGIVEPCIAKSLSELTPAQIAALPKDAKP